MLLVLTQAMITLPTQVLAMLVGKVITALKILLRLICSQNLVLKVHTQLQLQPRKHLIVKIVQLVWFVRTQRREN